MTSSNSLVYLFYIFCFFAFSLDTFSFPSLLHVGTTDNYHSCLQNLLLTLKHNKKTQFDEVITTARSAVCAC